MPVNDRSAPGDDPAFAATEPQDDWPLPSSLPLARPDLTPVELDDNVAIYDDQGQVLVLFNSTAHAVLERCDGQTAFEDIVSDLADLYAERPELIVEDASRTLRKLSSMGLVADAVG